MGTPRPRSPGQHVKELEGRLAYIRRKQWEWTNKGDTPYFVGEIEALEWALPILRRARVYEEDAHLLRQGRRVTEEGSLER
jgi:hypothetical protein